MTPPLRDRVLALADSFYDANANRHELAQAVMALVAEECAKVCDLLGDEMGNGYELTRDESAMAGSAYNCAAAIRKLAQGEG